MSLMNPIININGETRESHVEKRLTAKRKAFEALQALAELKPHGRDYLGDMERQNADMNVYNARFNAVVTLYNDLEQEALAIHEG